MLPRATHALVLAHLALVALAVVLAAVCLVLFTTAGSDADPLIGFLVVYAVALGVYAVVAGPLAYFWLRTRSYAFALPLGLWTLLVAALPAVVMLGAEPWWVLAGLLSVALPAALTVCGLWGLWRGVRPARSGAGWPG